MVTPANRRAGPGESGCAAVGDCACSPAGGLRSLRRRSVGGFWTVIRVVDRSTAGCPTT